MLLTPTTEILARAIPHLGCVLMEKEIAERNSNGKEAGWELTNQNNSVPLFHTRAPHGP